jgi:hypothetical protein
MTFVHWRTNYSKDNKNQNHPINNRFDQKSKRLFCVSYLSEGWFILLSGAANMPKQSKFLLNIICGTENPTEEIRGKVQCIPSGLTSTFTNIDELHEFILKEIHSMTDIVESGHGEKPETSVQTAINQYPVIDYAKELNPPADFT